LGLILISLHQDVNHILWGMPLVDLSDFATRAYSATPKEFGWQRTSASFPSSFQH
jgi:hypothetical protein